MPFTHADVCGIFSFFERSSPSLPPTRPVFSRYVSIGCDAEQLQHAVALEPVGEREERVRAGHAQELALLGGAAGRRAGGLAEHEVRGGLLLVQLAPRPG